MFKAYILNLDEIDFLIKNEKNTSIYENVRNDEIDSFLERKLNAKPSFLNGSELIKLYFPKKTCPVFLSHSGLDKNKVEQFAQWLKNNFDINSFIDSDLWGRIEGLQKKMENHRSDKPIQQKMVEYVKKRNINVESNDNGRYESSVHAQMMLCHALTQMIDEAECFIFLESSNSISNQRGQKGTFSPWIFHELTTIEIIRQNKNRESIPEDLSEQLNCSSQMEGEGAKNKPKVFYDIPLKRFFQLSKENLYELKLFITNFYNVKNTISDPYSSESAQLANGCGNGILNAKEKWGKALNWLYANCKEKAVLSEANALCG
ncbi:MAG: hypothetical protein MJZ76_08530 [Bacteroidales bacterium]|nr:hypothetical protein [Bacteroidales bacterium]